MAQMHTERVAARDGRKWSAGVTLGAFLVVFTVEVVAFLAARDNESSWLVFYWAIPVVVACSIVLVLAGRRRVGWGLLVGTAAAFVAVLIGMVALIGYLISVGAFA